MMKKQSRVVRSVLSASAGMMLFVVAEMPSAATSITWVDEDVVSGTFSVSNKVSTLMTTTPFVCGSLGTPGSNAGNQINATFPGAVSGQGNFLFGALSGGAQVPVPGLGAWNFSPTTGLVITRSDPTLVCYALAANGVRKMTADLFLDTFDSPRADGAVAVRVAQLPSAGNFYTYQYFIDVTIPVASTTLATAFRLRDGYDSSVFTSANYYCDVPIGTTVCPGATTTGNVDVAIPLPASTAYSRRFIVQRQIPNTGTLPAGKPLVLAALFSPPGLETRLDNNVAQGFAAISDMAPTVNTSSTDLSGITEGGSKRSVTFTISDDTSEQPGQLLSANVSINFNGTVVSGPADCTGISGSSPLSAPVTRTCSFDVVTPSSNFATDGITAGTFAPGITSSVTITATDRLGQTGAASVLPLHVASIDNDAPVFDFDTTAAPVDTQTSLPTLTCSLAQTSAPACLGMYSGFVKNLAAAPADAIDELAYQGAALNVGSAASLAGYYYITCGLDSGSASIFALNGAPSVAREASGGRYALDYSLSGNIGGATCTLVARDGSSYPGNTYPAGQSIQLTSKQFRIVVTN